jgi:hypothetical protein
MKRAFLAYRGVSCMIRASRYECTLLDLTILWQSCSIHRVAKPHTQASAIRFPSAAVGFRRGPLRRLTAAADCDHMMAVVKEAIEEHGGYHGITEPRAPFGRRGGCW